MYREESRLDHLHMEASKTTLFSDFNGIVTKISTVVHGKKTADGARDKDAQSEPHCLEPRLGIYKTGGLHAGRVFQIFYQFRIDCERSGDENGSTDAHDEEIPVKVQR